MKAMLRSRLTRAALAAVVVLPLLYAGLYLWSFWDPQGNLDRLPVALVMEDRPATADGKTVEAGKELAEELSDREVFSWRRTTAQEAADGVNDGSFYLALTIPRDFSARLTSPSDDKVTPTPALLGLRVDTGRSYIVGTISDAVFNEVRAAAGRTAIRDYFDKVFVSIGDIHDKTTEAADGAGELHDGTVKAGDGVSQLNNGLGTAENGAKQLTVGLGTANSATAKLQGGVVKLQNGVGKLQGGTAKLQDGSQKVTQGIGQAREAMGRLKTGLDQLGDGAGKLADGNRQAHEQVAAQSGTVNQLADKYVPVLTQYGPVVADAANAVAEAADRLAGGLDGLAQRTSGNAQETASQARAALDLLDGDADPQLRSVLRGTVNAAERTAAQADQLRERLGGTSNLAEQARELARSARKVAALAPELGPKLDQIRDQVNALEAGLGKLADGAAKLQTGAAKAGEGVTKAEAGAVKLENGSQQVTAGITKLSGGIGQLDGGLGRLNGGLGKLGGGLVKLGDGAGQLQSGVGKLHDGAGKVDAGMTKLTKGSQDLADGLDEGAGKIPDYDKQQREARTDVMSDPVRLAKTVDNEVPNYGTGFAPFFLPLALWVGAMIAFMVLKPLNQRRLASASGPLRIVFAGWLPAAALGVAQVGVLLAVLKFALGLEAAHWAGVAGLLLLTAAAFMAIVQAVNALLGAPGRVAALALLMLQLTSAAGTYPIETSPGFFQTISPWLPMSWVVSALRRLISGGDLTVVWQACGVLSAFLALGLALTALAVERSRMWSMKRLHPELSL
ncbi:YhgE/Pip family protein [Nonomuraea typhae]|uniref:YhgE/Pip family protein n=1 Tax=Nonomuraea typhae TaxID=2603600 RepID=A0ABW7Z0L4_9ACTN